MAHYAFIDCEETWQAEIALQKRPSEFTIELTEGEYEHIVEFQKAYREYRELVNVLDKRSKDHAAPIAAKHDAEAMIGKSVVLKQKGHFLSGQKVNTVKGVSERDGELVFTFEEDSSRVKVSACKLA